MNKINKILLCFLISVIFCKTTENQTKTNYGKEKKVPKKELQHNQEESENNYFKKDNNNQNTLTEEIKKETEDINQEIIENNQKKTEEKKLVLSKEDYEFITYYKNLISEQEKKYLLDKKKYLEDREFIFISKQKQKKEEENYEIYKKNYLINEEQEKQNKEKILNQIDPERSMFWRIDFNSEFPEKIIFEIDQKTTVILCEISDPIRFLKKTNFDCNSSLIKIDISQIENSNFFEQISLFQFLPNKKGYYLIFQEINQERKAINLTNNKNEIYTINFIETDGENLLKIQIYLEKIIQNKKRIYFKIISPYDFLFSLSK